MYSNEELKSISTQVRRDIVRMVTLGKVRMCSSFLRVT